MSQQSCHDVSFPCHILSLHLVLSPHVSSCLLPSLTCPLIFLSCPLFKSQLQVSFHFLSSDLHLSHSLSLHLSFFFSPSFCLLSSPAVKPLYPLHSPFNSPVRLSLFPSISRSACPLPGVLRFYEHLISTYI